MFTLMVTVLLIAVVALRSSVSGAGTLYMMAMLGDVALAYIFRDFIVTLLMSI